MKGQNEWDIILMTVLRSDGDPWDQCHLTPQGVPVLRVVLDSVIRTVLFGEHGGQHDDLFFVGWSWVNRSRC